MLLIETEGVIYLFILKKVLKCCPRFSMRRQNKDNEALQHSTPKTALDTDSHIINEPGFIAWCLIIEASTGIWFNVIFFGGGGEGV